MLVKRAVGEKLRSKGALLSLLIAGFFSLALRASPTTIACVDCYSSASLYPAVLERLVALGLVTKEQADKVRWVLVQTHPYSEDQEKYVSHFPPGSVRLSFDGTKKSWQIAAAEALRREGVQAVIGGMDEGSFQSPLLSAELGLPHNPVDTRDLRKQKKLQMEAVGDYGIPTKPLEDVEAVLKWIETFPHDEIVVKFNDGVSGVGMEYFSKNDRELKAKLLAKQAGPKIGPFGKEDFFIVQPRIRGRKFFINTYTFEGKAVVTGLSEYFMIDWNGTSLYFIDPFLPLDSALAKALEPLAAEFNSRLDAVLGAAHIEIIQDALTGKYYLLENNVRIAGAGVPALEADGFELGQMELHLLSILNPEKLRELLATYPRKRVSGGLIAVVPSAYDGTLSAEGVRKIQSLPSYFLPGPQYALRPGKRVYKTKDQSTAELIHFRGGRAQIRQGVESIVELVKSGSLVTPLDGQVPCSSLLASLGSVLEESIRSMDWEVLPP